MLKGDCKKYKKEGVYKTLLKTGREKKICQ